MPTMAHDRVRRGPAAALLILLSLLLTGISPGVGNEIRERAARFGPSRHGPATAVLQAAARHSPDDESPGAGVGSSLPPSGPAIVTERLRTRPRADNPSGNRLAIPQPANTSYRARAPPAS